MRKQTLPSWRSGETATQSHKLPGVALGARCEWSFDPPDLQPRSICQRQPGCQAALGKSSRRTRKAMHQGIPRQPGDLICRLVPRAKQLRHPAEVSVVLNISGVRAAGKRWPGVNSHAAREQSHAAEREASPARTKLRSSLTEPWRPRRCCPDVSPQTHEKSDWCCQSNLTQASHRNRFAGRSRHRAWFEGALPAPAVGAPEYRCFNGRT